MLSAWVTLWQRAAFLVKAISPRLPDLETGPKIAPTVDAWGGFHEKTILDVSGLRRCDFALRRCAGESAERRRRSADTATAIPSHGELFPVARQLCRGPHDGHAGQSQDWQYRDAQSRLSPRAGVQVGRHLRALLGRGLHDVRRRPCRALRSARQ